MVHRNRQSNAHVQTVLVRDGTVLLVVELEMMEDFPPAEVVRAATFCTEVI